jgi:hypothetical protein
MRDFCPSPKLYTSIYKNARRRAVSDSARVVGKKRAVRIVYLDGEMGEATRYFQEVGVHANMLEPINKSRDACLSIHHQTGVTATRGDITSVLKAKRKGARVVWMDMEQNSLTQEDLRVCLQSADAVHCDLTCRARDPMDVIDEHIRLFEACGIKRSTIEWGRYAGRTGKSMVYLACHPGA